MKGAGVRVEKFIDLARVAMQTPRARARRVTWRAFSTTMPQDGPREGEGGHERCSQKTVGPDR